MSGLPSTGDPVRKRACPGSGAIAGSPHASGYRGGKHPDTVPGAGRKESTKRFRSTLADLLAPDKPTLRRPSEQVSTLFFGLLPSQPRRDDEPHLTTRELAEILPHGALAGGVK